MLRLSRRSHPTHSGKFTYFDSEAVRKRTFIWDDAGIDKNGRVVLIEEELGGVIPLHIEGHLARLKVMMAKGESIGGVVWVVKERDFNKLYDLLRFYRRYVSPLPQMEIWSARGTRLGSLDQVAANVEQSAGPGR